MKISAEVRAFAASQAATPDHPGDGLRLEREAQRSAGEFARLNPSPVHPEEASPQTVRGTGEEDALSSPQGVAKARLEGKEAEAEAGMAAMSERYREIGSELYIGAAGREHD